MDSVSDPMLHNGRYTVASGKTTQMRQKITLLICGTYCKTVLYSDNCVWWSATRARKLYKCI